MKPAIQSLLAAVLLAGACASASAATAEAPRTLSEAQDIIKKLNYKHGDIDLKSGVAKLAVPPQFSYLDGADTRTVLEKLWHNPPNPEVLGMLLPADKSPLSEDGWGVILSYAADGYVKDNDAAKINYDDLLKKMQEDIHKNNAERTKQGYPTIELVGWAAPPHYDSQTHKLYWAKEAKFGESDENTLNYNIRILGRRGVLVLNIIAPMSRLADIQERVPAILEMVNFNDGNRYADFDPKIDKVATYGIAALVAGGVAAKLGFFKLIWVFILAAKKLIIVAFLAVSAWLKKVFSGRSKNSST